MVTIYKINPEHKKKVYKDYKNSKRWPKIVNAFLLSIIVSYTLGCYIYVTLLHPEFLISCILISIFAALIIIWIVQILIVRVMVGYNLTNRVNESLEYNSKYIIYKYQTKLGRYFNEWLELEIPLRFISDISYDNDTKKISIYGMLHTRCYTKDSGALLKIEDVHTFDTFTIFDYLEPSLKEDLSCAKKEKCNKSIK